MIFVDVHEEHVSQGAVKFFKQLICIPMIRGGHLVNDATEANEFLQ